MTPDERRKKARELRTSGMTFREIGKAMCVSAERARQLQMAQTWDEKSAKIWPELKKIDRVLAVRIENALSRNGIHTIEELKAVSPKQIRSMRNVGKKSFEIIMKIRGREP